MDIEDMNFIQLAQHLKAVSQILRHRFMALPNQLHGAKSSLRS